MKIVINADFGGFDLSFEAYKRIAKLKGWTHAVNDYDNDYWIMEPEKYKYAPELNRNDPDLVAVVEELGEESWGTYSVLKVVEIPDDVDWYIDEYDGKEHVAEQHRTWG